MPLAIPAIFLSCDDGADNSPSTADAEFRISRCRAMRTQRCGAVPRLVMIAPIADGPESHISRISCPGARPGEVLPLLVLECKPLVANTYSRIRPLLGKDTILRLQDPHIVNLAGNRNSSHPAGLHRGLARHVSTSRTLHTHWPLRDNLAFGSASSPGSKRECGPERLISQLGPR